MTSSPLSFRQILFAKKNRTLLILGNSVAGQLDGYAPCLATNLMDEYPELSSISRVALGAMGSMGIASFWSDLVTEKSPGIIFLDTFTADVGWATSVSDIALALEWICDLSMQIDSTLIFLHLPRNDKYLMRRAEIINIYNKVAQKNRIPSVDLQSVIETKGIDELLYDGVHTTSEGGRVISEAIASSLSNLWVPVEYVANEPKSNSLGVRVVKFDSLNISGSFMNKFPYIELGCDQTFFFDTTKEELLGIQLVLSSQVGVVSLETDGFKVKVQTWDKYLNQKARLGYLRIPESIRGKGNVILRVLSDSLGEQNINGEPTSVEHQGSKCRLIGAVVRSRHEQ